MNWFVPAIILTFTLTAFKSGLADDGVRETTMEQVNEKALETIFSGEETLHYTISWSGGVKIGDLYLGISKTEVAGRFVIQARVTDYGLFKLFYPVDDTFTTTVEDPLKLPVRYEVHQKEGWNGDETHRLYLYDHDKLQITYQKNGQAPETFKPDGRVYNEFSAFFITRGLDFTEDRRIVVPTFADKQRHEVEVEVVGREYRNSLFGQVDTIQIMPKMSFKGLYDKDGDTVFWLTDDVCRIPIEIQSKIVVGSLRAELVEYSNPACSKFVGGKKKTPKFVDAKEK